MQPEVRVLGTPEETFAAAAEEFVLAVSRGDGPVRVALSGGSTPRPLYSLLADPSKPYRGRIPWPRLHVFWSDERHAPPDHPSSNYRMACESLLSKVPLPPGNVHRVAGERSDAVSAAAAYEAEIERHFGLLPGVPPRFDLILLGLGGEGHVASLFPESPAFSETGRLVSAPWVEEVQARRITLTPGVINAAARILLLVVGGEKAAIVRAVLQGPRRPTLVPAQSVAPAAGRATWLLDAAAGGAL